MSDEEKGEEFEEPSDEDEERGPHVDLEDELTFYKSPLAEGPLILLTIILIGAASYFTIQYPATVQKIPLFTIFNTPLSLPIPLFGIIPLMLVLWVIHSLYDQRYMITHDHVRCIKGLISISKSDIFIEYQDMRGIELDRSLYGRIVNTGDILIGSAMAGEVEMILPGVYDPSWYRDLVLERKRDYLETHSMHVSRTNLVD